MSRQASLQLTITGKIADVTVTQTVEFSTAELCSGSSCNDVTLPLHRLCAKAQIQELQDQEELAKWHEKGISLKDRCLSLLLCFVY